METRETIERIKSAVYRRTYGLGLEDRDRKILLSCIEAAYQNQEESMSKPEPPLVVLGPIPRPVTFEQSVDAILAELRELMISKQRDYGPKNIMDSGIMGVLIRANDKMARLRNLFGISDGSYQEKAAKNEAIEDSFKDLANYGIIALMVRRGVFDLPLGS